MKNLLIALSALLVVALMTVGLVLAFTPESHTHEYTSQVDVAATCTANGKLLYTCACGHSYAEKIDALGHSFTKYVSDNNTTCTADGTLTAKCDRCDATDTKVDEGSMLPHTYASYVDNGDDHTKSCSCGASITEAHIWEETAKVYPTHTEEGSADYACVCGATKHEVLDMLVGCDYNQEVEDWWYLLSPATCTEAAVYYKSCVCGEYSEDADTFTVGEPNGHSNEPWTLASVDAQAQTAVLSYVCWSCDEDVILNITFADCVKAGTPATCETDGLETVTYVYYIGADEHELVVYSGVIEALGHDYSAPTYTWSDDYTTCSATMTCANDASHVVSENANVDINVIAPKCFEGGKTVYTANFANSSFETQVKEGNETAQLGTHTWNGISCTVCNAVKLEAEVAEILDVVMLDGKTRYPTAGLEGKTPETTNYPSGDGFVYFISDTLTTTLKFYVTASESGKATVTLRMGCATNAAEFKNLFDVYVNGVKMTSRPDVVFPKYTTINYYEWLELVVADIELQAGENVVELIKPIPDDPANAGNTKYGLNCDYMSIIPENSSMIIEETREKTNGHSFTKWDVTGADYNNAGSATGYCDYCRAKKTVELPVVSAANGYVQLSYGVKSVWEYTTTDGSKIKVEVAEEAQKFSYIVSGTDDVFSSVVDNNGPDTTGKTTNIDSNSYGIFYEVTQGATFTFKVNASQATEAVFVLVLRGNGEYNVNKTVTSLSVTAGGQTTAATINTDLIKYSGWAAANNVSTEIATINLVEGENIITFTMGDMNVNIAGAEILAFADITRESTKIFHGGKIANIDPLTKNGAKDNTPVTNASNGVYYQNNQNATFTMNVTVDKDVDAILFFDMTSTNNKAYGAGTVVSSITVNGTTVSLNTTGSFTTKGWSAANDVKATIAVLPLKAGENTITIVFGSNNINISGVQLYAACDLTFGKN